MRPSRVVPALFVVAIVLCATSVFAQPVLVLPGSITVEAAGPSGNVVTYVATSDGVVIGDDENGRGATALCTPRSGSTYPVGNTLVTCTARDASGNTSIGSFFVRVVDTTAPALFVPAEITVTTTGSSEVVNFTATATDAVDGSVSVACTPPSGSSFNSGVTIVSCSATDAHGNTATDSFEITVAGSTPPVLNLPNITAEATSASGANVTYGENVDNLNCTPPSGSLFALGASSVNCSTETLSGSFTVTVVDTTPPELSLPSPITVEATSPSSTPVTWTATANDLVDGAVSVVCTPPSGSGFAIGTTTVNCSATDAHNNTSTGNFTVSVVDTTPPVITSLTASPNSLWPPNKKMVLITVTGTVQDAGDPAPILRIYNVTANETIVNPPSANADWQLVGNLAVNLRADRNGNGTGRIYTIHLEAIDASGNRSTSTVTVKVPHDQSGKGHI